MEIGDKRYQPRLTQAAKLHLSIIALGAAIVLVLLPFRGMWVDLVDKPLLGIGVAVLAGTIVLATDFFKFRKWSPREIALTDQTIRIEMRDGQQRELRWREIQSARSEDLNWTITSSDQELVFSVAGITRPEQKELIGAISAKTAEHRKG